MSELVWKKGFNIENAWKLETNSIYSPATTIFSGAAKTCATPRRGGAR
jgi:hypothetical protein